MDEERDADVLGAARVRFWLHAIDLHPERVADAGDPRAELAEAEQPEGPAVEVGAERACHGPSAAARVLPAIAPGEREEQRPGRAGGRMRQLAGAAHGDAALGRRPSMSIAALRMPVVISSFSLGRRASTRARERRPLAHRHDDVEVPPAARPASSSVRRTARSDRNRRRLPTPADQSAIVSATFW